MNIRLKKLTRKQMAKLPFPFTTKALGGILEVVPDEVDLKTIEKIRKEWRKFLEKEEK